MAYFGRTSRCGKLATKPNPRLKNCSKTSQEPSAQSGLSSYQYYWSQRLQSEKSQMRIFPNSGDFILIPTYNGRMKKFNFRAKIPIGHFLAKHMRWSHQPSQRQQVLLHCLGCLVGAVTFLLSLSWLSALPQFAHAIAKIARVAAIRESDLARAISQKRSRELAKAFSRKRLRWSQELRKQQRWFRRRKRDCDDITTRESDRDDTATRIAMIPRLVKAIAMMTTPENDHNGTVTRDSVRNDLAGRKSNCEDTTNYASHREDREVAKQLLRRWLQLSSFDKKNLTINLKNLLPDLESKLVPAKFFLFPSRKEMIKNWWNSIWLRAEICWADDLLDNCQRKFGSVLQNVLCAVRWLILRTRSTRLLKQQSIVPHALWLCVSKRREIGSRLVLKYSIR